MSFSAHADASGDSGVKAAAGIRLSPAATRIASELELVLIGANTQQPSTPGTGGDVARPKQALATARTSVVVKPPGRADQRAALPAADSLTCLAHPAATRCRCRCRCLLAAAPSPPRPRPAARVLLRSLTRMRPGRLPAVALVCRIQLEPAQPRALAARNAPRNLHATHHHPHRRRRPIVARAAVRRPPSVAFDCFEKNSDP
ncbi:hypothetical protein B0J12DRAFT_762614 [Macrophomina phaseolina]|uniref:Uncharacterized protein n=1 Tax=Macrophomina phaseolina TaxID=35725 RepID=A0ABQ8G280_9PEZI|nr:hypothetical protein B0J12DRAFT_762614 [Macrophomina phaseolina]